MSKMKIVVNLVDGRSYDVSIGAGRLAGLGSAIAAVCPRLSRVALISDSNVAPLYGDAAKASLAEADIGVLDITVPAGETSKSPEVLVEIERAMAASHLGRDCAVVALGGGVVGDLSGFAAATYMRGVTFIQVPTTLLAMVDSSVGGKTAVNIPEGKNLMGAFLQPALVCADTATLATLDEREWACGCGEVAKSALLEGDDFFFWLSEHADGLVSRDEATVAETIARCVVFKADVVAADERETAGVRECLNLGHTLAHAIETCAGYGTYSHGAAVVEGIRFALRLGAEVVQTPMEVVEAADDLFDALNLPELAFPGDVDDLLDVMMGDKKVRDGRLRFVLLSEIGHYRVEEVDVDTVRSHLQARHDARMEGGR